MPSTHEEVYPRVATHSPRDTTEPQHAELDPDAKPATEAQRAVFDALQEFCFNGPTCWPSQETLAHRTGYSVFYVNRLLRQLRDLGLIAWTKRKGRKWLHNVYTLARWVPPLRSRTIENLAWIRALKAAKERSVQAKRTPKPFQGSNETDTPCSVIRKHQPQWSRARQNQRETERSTMNGPKMMFAKAKRVLTGPPVGAHGRRADGSYWSIWQCQHGHGTVGEVDSPPKGRCHPCMRNLEESDTVWTCLDRHAAHRFLLEIEGPGYDRKAGFDVL